MCAACGEVKPGTAVKYVLGGVVQWAGIAEYIRGGWVGIRQADGRLDEAQARFVERA